MNAWRVPPEQAALVKLIDMAAAALVIGGVGALAFLAGRLLMGLKSEPFESAGMILIGAAFCLGPALGVGLLAALVCRRTGLIGPASALTAGVAIGAATGLVAHLTLGFGAPVERAIILPLVGAVVGGALGALFQLVARALRPAAFTAPR